MKPAIFTLGRRYQYRHPMGLRFWSRRVRMYSKIQVWSTGRWLQQGVAWMELQVLIWLHIFLISDCQWLSVLSTIISLINDYQPYQRLSALSVIISLISDYQCDTLNHFKIRQLLSNGQRRLGQRLDQGLRHLVYFYCQWQRRQIQLRSLICKYWSRRCFVRRGKKVHPRSILKGVDRFLFRQHWPAILSYCISTETGTVIRRRNSSKFVIRTWSDPSHERAFPVRPTTWTRLAWKVREYTNSGSSPGLDIPSRCDNGIGHRLRAMPASSRTTARKNVKT